MESGNFTNKANSHTPKEEIHTRPKLCHFDLYVMRATLFCLKSFVSLTGLECSYEKTFIPVTEISVASRDLGNQASPASHMNTSIFFTKKRVARRDLGNRASPVDRAHMKRP